MHPMDFPGGQWLRLHTSNAGGTSSIPGWGTKIPHAMRHSQKTERKKKKIHAPQCSQQRYLQKPIYGTNLSVQQQIKG